MLALLAAALLAPLGADDSVTLQLLSEGASRKLNGYRPQQATLSSSRPETINILPQGLEAPLYGVFKIAGAVKADFHVILDEPEGKPARLFIDANGNGDLTDDLEVSWKGTPQGKEKKYLQFNGSVKLNLGTPAQPYRVNIGMYRFDKDDPGHAAQKNILFFYRDYALEGELVLSGKRYNILLSDDNATGDFRGKKLPPDADPKETSGATLFIDVNANGKVDARGEEYDVRKPFNIGGTTYEIANLPRNGLTFQLKVAAEPVAVVPLPPDHAVGKKITPFEAKATDGTTVSFPAAYKGKIVMIDFWATWCGPCMQEVPNLVKVYNAYHEQGFEVLGVSLDNEKSVERLPTVTAEKGMTWTQICDAKWWDAAIAKLYVIRSIPACFLVDGDTGEILEGGLRGEALEKTVQQALDRKKAGG